MGGNPISVSKYLIFEGVERCKEDRARLSLVVPSDRMRGNKPYSSERLLF